MMAHLMQSQQKDAGPVKSVPPDGGTAGNASSPSSKLGATSRNQLSGAKIMAGSNAAAQLPQDQTPQKCPRCDSLNTKFCYYNNYSLSQPRHFCKNCRRYWTRGGALRNVPVGGGCRKNKRVKQRLDPASALAVAQLPPPGLMDLSGVHRSDGLNMIPGGHSSIMHGILSSLNVLNMQQPNALLPPSSISTSSLMSELAQMKESGGGAGMLLQSGFSSQSPFCSGSNLLIPSSNGGSAAQSLFADHHHHHRVVSSPPSASAQQTSNHLLSAYDHITPPPPPPFSTSSNASSSLIPPQQPPHISSLYSSASPELSHFSLYDPHSSPAGACSGTLVDHLSSFNGGELKDADGGQAMGSKGRLMGVVSSTTTAGTATTTTTTTEADQWGRSADQMQNSFFLQASSGMGGSLWSWPEMHSSTTTTAAGAMLN